MAMAYGVNAQAVGKVVLHGAKYGAGEVCGALLGRWDGAEDGPVLVEDAVPFFHKCENKYSPLMEVALAQVSERKGKDRVESKWIERKESVDADAPLNELDGMPSSFLFIFHVSSLGGELCEHGGFESCGFLPGQREERRPGTPLQHQAHRRRHSGKKHAASLHLADE
mmetsp:Transcript_18949/g.39546  ORF Transcript_18949/g.39546 Transcript_18949/m.39546 type:complete len:168 (-) Transcript_18949:425-928(-)